jgi:NIPSNAP
MKRRHFMKSSLLATPLSTGVLGTAMAANSMTTPPVAAAKEWYEWREYEFNFNSPRGEVEKYFKNALIPAYNKLGIKAVGVFTEMGKSDPAKMYMLIPYASLEDFKTINEKVKMDEDYKKAAEGFYGLPADKPPFNRMSSSLMLAFDGLPNLLVPKNEPRIFEVRSYEGYSDDAVRRKVLMFNKEEFDIFYKTGLNPVFFGEVMAGGNMPRLTYMITFKNMEEHDKNWAKFSANEVWKRISKAPEYANTVSKIYKTFLEPAAYSQL